ncbi:hypothetical protein ACFVW9_15000 [Streptomyces sp. NPDC058217]|uniref:hypothetical protein n=1 Tax=Streptomyces sp. NPDC058217 TaxID=3346384 RepID=UPI0036E4F751
MSLTTPTPADVKALSDFMLQRADEEWEAMHASHENDTLDPDDAARFYRISNSNKLGIAGTTAGLLGLLERGDAPEQVSSVWHFLTAAGEEWRDHPDYEADSWENPQRALVRQMIAGG